MRIHKPQDRECSDDFERSVRIDGDLDPRRHGYRSPKLPTGRAPEHDLGRASSSPRAGPSGTASDHRARRRRTCGTRVTSALR